MSPRGQSRRTRYVIYTLIIFACGLLPLQIGDSLKQHYLDPKQQFPESRELVVLGPSSAASSWRSMSPLMYASLGKLRSVSSVGAISTVKNRIT